MAVIVVGDVDRDAVVDDDQGALLVADLAVAGAAAAGVRRAGASRHALRRRHRQGDDARRSCQLSNLRPARNQGSVGGYREIMLDQLFGAHARATGSTSSARARIRRFCRPPADRALFPTPRTRDEAVLQALVSNDGVTRGLDALVTELQRVARFGFTATELDRAKQAMMRELRARRRRRARTASRRAAPTSTRATSSRTKRCRRSGRSSRSTGGSSRRSRWPRSTRSPRDWFPERNRLVVVSAPEAAGVVAARLRRSSRPSSATAAAKRLEGVRRCGRRAQTLMDAPPARGTIVKTAEPASRPGSPSGRCRTAPPSCSSRRR